MTMTDGPDGVKDEGVRALSDAAFTKFWRDVGLWRKRTATPARFDGPGGFWDRVDRRGGPDACWPWQMPRRTRGGYGSVDMYGRSVGSHRRAWELTHGPIPNGLWVLHKCDNPPCCNPAHLFLGTNAENVADRQAKGRTRQGVRAGHVGRRLTKEMVDEIRLLGQRGMSSAALARKFGVSRNCVADARSYRSWKSKPAGGVTTMSGTTARNAKKSGANVPRTERTRLTERLYQLIAANPWCTIGQLSKWTAAQHTSLYTSLRSLRGLMADGSPGKSPVRVQMTGGRRWCRYAVIGAAPLTANGAAS